MSNIYIDDVPVEVFKFPGGELQVKVNPNSSCYIEAFLYSSDDIMTLLLTVDAIRRMGCYIKKLIIPYFPYARQDRVCNSGESLAIKIMADLINNLNIPQVNIIDPHSNVTPALLNNCVTYDIVDLFIQSNKKSTLIPSKNITFVSPDAGAEKKVTALAATFKAPLITASKIRNTLTGEITGTKVHEDVTGKDLYVIDDICDGGRTFIELAKVLKEKSADKLYLYTTHGIFSKGLDELKLYYNHVYCYHTFLSEYDKSFLTVLEDI